MRSPISQQLDGDLRSSRNSIKGNFSEFKNSQSFQQDDKNIEVFPTAWELSMEEVLLKSARAICARYKIQFAQLTTIQRKFVTNYRCSQCGLLPLYHINLLHVKRVRCRKCGQLITFKKTGKYGRLRKEIASQLMKEIQGGVIHALR